MSDDLISRKALIAELEKWCGKQRYLIPENVWELIETEPVAFDKEKVIEELREELNLSDAEKERCARENPLQFDSAKGYANGIANAIDIVEKGGIE
nr:MAG TPA: ENT domain protein [Caudoviricetes sp.]